MTSKHKFLIFKSWLEILFNLFTYKSGYFYVLLDIIYFFIYLIVDNKLKRERILTTNPVSGYCQAI